MTITSSTTESASSLGRPQQPSNTLPMVDKETVHISQRQKSRWQRGRRWLLIAAALLITVTLIGRDGHDQSELTDLAIGQIFRDWRFDLLGWEVDSVSGKISAAIERPAADLSDDEATQMVRTYLDRAREIALLEADLNRLALGQSAPDEPEDQQVDAETIQAQLDELRGTQDATRLTVEAIIQKQIGQALMDEGLTLADQPFPPVLFSFTEPPKKLIVSPRDRIETRYAQMLDAEIPLDTIEQAEQKIFQEQNLSAYITNIGGLGAFPTMVVDRASLGWVLSTVAHEWTHNYLTLFPLGINYSTTHELTIMNETVAEIVGDEIGLKVAKQFYPDIVPPTPVPEVVTTQAAQSAAEGAKDAQTNKEDEGQSALESVPESDEPPPFDYRAEMRDTRQQVDQLLADGQVEEAERFMEERRLHFVENGYNLRVLNQAYFAFHGSYGTNAASTSTIGPKLEALREHSPNLKGFIETIRWIKSEAEIDNALETIKKEN